MDKLRGQGYAFDRVVKSTALALIAIDLDEATGWHIHKHIGNQSLATVFDTKEVCSDEFCHAFGFIRYKSTELGKGHIPFRTSTVSRSL